MKLVQQSIVERASCGSRRRQIGQGKLLRHFDCRMGAACRAQCTEPTRLRMYGCARRTRRDCRVSPSASATQDPNNNSASAASDVSTLHVPLCFGRRERRQRSLTEDRKRGDHCRPASHDQPGRSRCPRLSRCAHASRLRTAGPVPRKYSATQTRIRRRACDGHGWASASRYCRLFRLLGTRVHKRRDAVSLNARLKSALAHAPESQRGAPSHVRGCPCAAGNLLAATCTWTAIVVRRFFGRALTFVGFVLEVPSPRAILSERRS